MKKSQQKTLIIIVAWLIIPVIVGLLFYSLVVAREGSTSIFSVIFGWQWLFLLGVAVYLAIKAIKEKSKRIALVFVTLFTGLAITFIPAYASQESGRYILGDGRPAGPEFNCLVWENSPNLPISQPERDFCIFMSIPSYTKAWIDQNPDHERDDSANSYYLTLWLDEVALAGFAYLALVLWLAPYQKKKNRA